MSDQLSRIVRGPLALVLAISLIAIGASSLVRSNTVAFFTASTQNPNNAFSSQQVTFSDTANGGTACVAGPAQSSSPLVCPAIAHVVTLSNIIPGDSKVGYVNLGLAAGATEAPVTDWLSVSLASSSTNLDSRAPSAGGLGVIVFRCYSGSTSPVPASVTAVADCSVAPTGSTALYLLPVYPSAVSNPCGALSGPTAVDSDGVARNTLALPAAKALVAGATGQISTPSNAANDTVVVAGTSCTAPGNFLTNPAQVPLGGPDAVAGVVSIGTVAQKQGLAAGDNDFLGVVAFLPTVAGNDEQNLSDTFNFTWTAEQKAGTAQ